MTIELGREYKTQEKAILRTYILTAIATFSDEGNDYVVYTFDRSDILAMNKNIGLAKRFPSDYRISTAESFEKMITKKEETDSE